MALPNPAPWSSSKSAETTFSETPTRRPFGSSSTFLFPRFARKHQVLMMELPLFPFRGAFGSAQRSIAAKYDVAMLPKRCFTKVLGTKDGTLDGLHLSQKGQDAMAEIVAGVLQKE